MPSLTWICPVMPFSVAAMPKSRRMAPARPSSKRFPFESNSTKWIPASFRISRSSVHVIVQEEEASAIIPLSSIFQDSPNRSPICLGEELPPAGPAARSNSGSPRILPCPSAKAFAPAKLLPRNFHRCRLPVRKRPRPELQIYCSLEGLNSMSKDVKPKQRLGQGGSRKRD